MSLELEIALIGGSVILAALPAVILLAIRDRRERRAAYRIAQLDKIAMPHPSITLYQSINRMGGNRK